MDVERIMLDAVDIENIASAFDMLGLPVVASMTVGTRVGERIIEQLAEHGVHIELRVEEDSKYASESPPLAPENVIGAAAQLGMVGGVMIERERRTETE